MKANGQLHAAAALTLEKLPPPPIKKETYEYVFPLPGVEDRISNIQACNVVTIPSKVALWPEVLYLML